MNTLFPSPLFEAVALGNLARVAALLADGEDVNAPLPPDFDLDGKRIRSGNAGRTPLMVAVVFPGGGYAQQLLDRRINVNLDRAKIIRLLIKCGADVHAVDETGITALHAAVRGGTSFVVRLLLDNGANVQAADATGEAPLTVAAHTGNAAVLRELLRRGAQVNAQDNEGRTALITAASHGHAKCVEALIKAGADVNATFTGRGGWTALHFAACNGHADCVRLLTRSGADVSFISRRGDTAAGLARANGFDAIAEWLEKVERA